MDKSRRKIKLTPSPPQHSLGTSDKKETKHSIAQTDLSLLCSGRILTPRITF